MNPHDLNINPFSSRQQSYRDARCNRAIRLQHLHAIFPITLFNITKLDKNNWSEWRYLFEGKMRSVHLDKLILNEFEDSEMQKNDWLDLDMKAHDNIKMNASEYLRYYVEKQSNAKRMYDKIVSHFEGSSEIDAWRLCKQLTDLLVNKPANLDETA